MAGELQAVNASGRTLYAIIRRATDGQVWYTTTPAFEAYNAAHWTAYAIALTPEGVSGLYKGDFPAQIGAGLYHVNVRWQQGGSPATSDPTTYEDTVSWTGSATVGDANCAVAALAPNSITAAVIATDAVDADALSMDAVAEIGAKITTDHGSGSYVRNTEPLDAAGVRSAVGLAAANLDTQLAGLAVPGSPMTLTTGERNSVANALLDLASAVEGHTPREILRGFAAALMGKVDGVGTGTVHARDLADTKNRITMTIDSQQDRTQVTLDLT